MVSKRHLFLQFMYPLFVQQKILLSKSIQRLKTFSKNATMTYSIYFIISESYYSIRLKFIWRKS